MDSVRNEISEEILNEALRLNKLITESDIYSQYRKSLLIIEQNSAYKQALDNFRRRQIEIEINMLNNGDLSNASEVEKLSDEYADILLISDCAEFIRCENELLNLIKGIFSNITDNLEIDLSFFV